MLFALPIALCSHHAPRAPQSHAAITAGSAAPEAAPAAAPTTTAATDDPRFHDRLLAIAREYRTWRSVEDTAAWAPLDCAPPPYVRVWISEAAPARSEHALKLYYLY